MAALRLILKSQPPLPKATVQPGLKLYMYKNRLTTTPQTANPIKGNCVGESQKDSGCDMDDEQKKSA